MSQNQNKSNYNSISISYGNKKMGCIPSVSLPPIVTCKNCYTCAKKCYAAKLCRIYPSVKNAYEKNLNILKTDRKSYFSQVENVAKLSRFFRWHVSGDIIDIDYLNNMVKIARRCKNTTFLAFTKNFSDCNEYFKNHKKPKNLQILFSEPFTGADFDNPYNFPVASVIFKGETLKNNQKLCGGNCAECGSCGIGCWTLKKGENIAFYEH